MKNDKDKRGKDSGKLRNYSEVLSFERLSDEDVQVVAEISAGGDETKE